MNGMMHKMAKRGIERDTTRYGIGKQRQHRVLTTTDSPPTMAFCRSFALSGTIVVFLLLLWMLLCHVVMVVVMVVTNDGTFPGRENGDRLVGWHGQELNEQGISPHTHTASFSRSVCLR